MALHAGIEIDGGLVRIAVLDVTSKQTVLVDFIEDTDIAQPEEIIEMQGLRAEVDRLLARLKPREERVLRRRYGISVISFYVRVALMPT